MGADLVRLFLNLMLEFDVDKEDYNGAEDEVIAGLVAQEFLQDPKGWVWGMSAESGDYLKLDVGKCVDPT